MIYLTLFLEFFKIGLFTFGGGFSMIPLVKETVLKYAWLTETEFYNFIGVCESTPGPIAINMATYVGNMQGGIFGGVIATTGVVLPSFIIILIIASVLKNLTENKYFKSFIHGVKPVVSALIISAGVQVLAKVLGYVQPLGFEANYSAMIIFALIVAAYFAVKKMFKKKMSGIQIILLSAVLGIGVCTIAEYLPL